MNPAVGIIMGSDSDLKIMEAAAEVLKKFGVTFEVTIVSAHRTPIRMVEYATLAHSRGLKVIIAGAGGAAHLPGMVASLTTLPVIGVPIKSSNSIDGWDSVLSILQMPNGVPVATVALNAAKNAGILAVEILAVADASLTQKLVAFKNEMKEDVEKKAAKMAKESD
jgi:5-(carboxyamino)imidazole ribonucleotide mutase